MLQQDEQRWTTKRLGFLLIYSSPFQRAEGPSTRPARVTESPVLNQLVASCGSLVRTVSRHGSAPSSPGDWMEDFSVWK
ncbi:hypothetical protein ILYODFUR_027619 [Ilyodon furcidens]|uniref:Uncharacterized protein n=1 Tax=Ilyodon furcidens TaxID=33524 RepID=A0ABV0TMI0_9TELE